MPPARAKERYTPHGYLANPHHCAKLDRCGVLRSSEPLGFALWYPNHPGPYGRGFGYCAELNLALRVERRSAVAPADLADWHAPVHTARRFTYAARVGAVEMTAAYVLVRRGLLRAVVGMRNASARAVEVRLFGLAQHVRNAAFSGLWEEGLLARARGEGTVELRSHPEGTAVVLACGGPARAAGCYASLAAARKAVRAGASPGGAPRSIVRNGRGENRVAGAVEVRAALPAGGRKTVTFSLAVSDMEAELADLLATPAAATRAAQAANESEDQARGDQSVALSGDWPDHWRRGLHYDFQTLRMCILPPRGIFRHPWDGMQIQAPRFVLAETTFDMFLHGYAFPREAQQVVRGALRDAPEPWMPCLREDGSANMIAWDGHPCGTAPEWGAPAWVLARLYRRRPDRRWLADVLGPLTAYLRWWDEHRTDEAGFAHYLCSYESGQDMSPRFDPQKGGGDDVTHCRPVDLQAAMADSWRFVAEAEALLGRPARARPAARRAEHYRARTEALWAGREYRDFSRRRGRFAAVRDVMHLTPFYYALADPAHAAAVRDRVREMCAAERQVWPTFQLVLAESAYRLGCPRELAAMAAERVEHVYAALDAPRAGRRGPLPGVQHEYWPDKPVWGAEGYGWGALCVALVVRYLGGWREDGPLAGEGFTLAPALPRRLARPGAVLRLHNLPALGRRFDLTYEVGAGGRLSVRLERRAGPPCRIALSAGDGAVLAAPGRRAAATIRNYARCRVTLSPA